MSKCVFAIGRDIDKVKKGKTVHFFKPSHGGFVKTLCESHPKSCMYIVVDETTEVTCEKCNKIHNSKVAFELAKEQGHICICKACSNKLFGVSLQHDFSRRAFRINKDFFIDNNCCDGCVCEIGECTNEADYTLNVEDARDEESRC